MELHSGGHFYSGFTFHVLFVEYYVCSLTRGVVLECFLHNWHALGCIYVSCSM